MFTIKELIKITNGKAFAAKDDLRVCGISTDSRSIAPGELFIAIKGDKFDGACFIEDARAKGAIAAIAHEGARAVGGFSLITVNDTRKALSAIAKAYREKFDIPVIAVTGSNGKTTTKDMIAHILSKTFKVSKTDENDNNEIGVAKTLLKLKDEDIAVVEIGSSSFGEIKRHADILKPSVALITNIGHSHLAGLKNIKGVLREKFALVESLDSSGVWIKNYDDKPLACMSRMDIKTISYGIISKDADFRAENIKENIFTLKASNLPARLSAKPRADKTATFKDIKLPLIGVHNIYNSLAAIATCSLFMEPNAAIGRLADFKPPHMRMELLKFDNFTVINDCYNSNPLSFKCALDSLRNYPANGKKIVVAADMLELGEDSNRLHYDTGRLFSGSAVDFLLAYGHRAADIARGAVDSGMENKRVCLFGDKAKLSAFLRESINNGDVVLVKGSRGMRMEEVVESLRLMPTRR